MAKSPYLSDEQLHGLIELFGPKETDDPLFGHLEFTWGHRHPTTWKGSIFFKPVGAQIDIYVGGPGQAVPTEKEREFYREVETRYSGLAEMAAENIYAYMKDVRADFRREDVWREFKLCALQIPNCVFDTRYWGLSYVCSSRGEDYRIRMLNWEMKELSVNGWPQSNSGLHPTANQR